MRETKSTGGATHKRIPVTSKLTIITVSVLAGFGIAMISYGVERALGIPSTGFALTDMADQLIAGVATAACIYFVWQRSRRAQLLNLQRFELISTSTQQIRDALQLITDIAQPGTPQQGVIIYAVDHIEWILQEVLPAVHQDPKEVRERVKKYATDTDESHIESASGKLPGTRNNLNP